MKRHEKIGKRERESRSTIKKEEKEKIKNKKEK